MRLSIAILAAMRLILTAAVFALLAGCTAERTLTSVAGHKQFKDALRLAAIAPNHRASR